MQRRDELVYELRKRGHAGRGASANEVESRDWHGFGSHEHWLGRI